MQGLIVMMGVRLDMTAIKPIPLVLLIHTVKYLEKTPDDGYGSSYKDEITIEKVRVSPQQHFKRTTTSIERLSEHVLLVDKFYSSVYPDFVRGSMIKWNEREFIIEEITPQYAFDGVTPHHYEIRLV